MSPLQSFFIASHASLPFYAGRGVALKYVTEGGYREAVDLLSCVLLAEKQNEPNFIIKASEEQQSADKILSYLKSLLISDPSSVKQLQSQGLSFLEVPRKTHMFDFTENRSLYALLTDTNPEMKSLLWQEYDARLGLDALMLSHRDKPLGHSSNEHGYHHDLIVRIMDEVSTERETDAVIRYLAECRFDSNVPEINWGVYLHKNATERLQSWILSNQQRNTVMTDSRLITANLKIAYAQPFTTLVNLSQSSASAPALEAMNRVGLALACSDVEKTKLGWLLSTEPEALKAHYTALSNADKHQMLSFAFQNSIPMPGSYVPGLTEAKKAMVEAGVLMIQGVGMPEGYAKWAIETEFNRLHSEEGAWSLPLVIQSDPEVFTEKFSGLDAWSRMQVIGKALRRLDVYTGQPSRVSKTFSHGNVFIVIGEQNSANSSGTLLLPEGEKTNLGIFFDTIQKCLQSTLESAVNFENQRSELNGIQKKSFRAIAKQYLEGIPATSSLALIKHDLLDKTCTQVVLSLRDVKPLLKHIEFPRGVIEKMSPGQRENLLTRDLGL